jgi:hypothetical protein
VVPLPIKDAGEMGIGNLYKAPHDHPVPECTNHNTGF